MVKITGKTDIKTVFGDNFRKLLLERKMTQAQVAAEFNLTPTTLQRWYKGQAIPTPENLDQLADFLDIEVAEFFVRDVKGDYEREYGEIDAKYRKNIIGTKGQGTESVECLHEHEDLRKRYAHLTQGGDFVLQEYAKTLNRVLPGISKYAIELLNLANLKSDGEHLYLLCILLHGILKDKARGTKFHRLITDMTINGGEDDEYWKRKLVRVACEIAGLPSPLSDNLTLTDKIKFLSPIEMGLIESSIDDLISNKKKNTKSVS